MRYLPTHYYCYILFNILNVCNFRHFNLSDRASYCYYAHNSPIINVDVAANCSALYVCLLYPLSTIPTPFHLLPAVLHLTEFMFSFECALQCYENNFNGI